MARLTISLPDALRERLEERAARRGLPLSQVACEALEAMLAAPEPAPEPDRNAGPVEIRAYLEKLRSTLEHLRATVDELAVINGPLALPPPPSMPRPPWIP